MEAELPQVRGAYAEAQAQLEKLRKARAISKTTTH